MGVELNFLVKKRRQIKAARIIAAVFTLVLVFAGGLFYMQWSALNTTDSAAQPSAVMAGADDMRAVRMLDPGMATMYQQVVQSLGAADLHTYEFDGVDTVQLTVSGDDVPSIQPNLERLPFVTSVEVGESDAGNRVTIATIVDAERLAITRGRGPQ